MPVVEKPIRTRAATPEYEAGFVLTFRRCPACNSKLVCDTEHTDEKTGDLLYLKAHCECGEQVEFGTDPLVKPQRRALDMCVCGHVRDRHDTQNLRGVMTGCRECPKCLGFTPHPQPEQKRQKTHKFESSGIATHAFCDVCGNGEDSDLHAP